MSNQREIKFRAWHPEWGEMVYASLGREWLWEKREFSPFVFEVGFSGYPIEGEWHIMQYTGLNDRNGIEIYEGDCIGHTGNVVEFLNGGFCINGDRPLSAFVGQDVVGNIYKSPSHV